jgi:pimeloyl-ACP methyl ester carboxylesterase
MTNPTYVCIPGAGGVAWVWHSVAAELRRRGHEAVTVDLPGDDESAGFGDYADKVVEAIGDRRGVVLVAQSMGGFTAALVAERVPVSALVLVNAMIPRPGETAGEWWDNTGWTPARRANDARLGRDPDAEFDLAFYFTHDLSAPVIDELNRRNRDEADTAFAQPYPLKAWPDVPTRVLVGRDDRFFPAAFQRRVAEERLGITPEEVPGGHLAPLSHPIEMAEALEKSR